MQRSNLAVLVLALIALAALVFVLIDGGSERASVAGPPAREDGEAIVGSGEGGVAPAAGGPQEREVVVDPGADGLAFPDVIHVIDRTGAPLPAAEVLGVVEARGASGAAAPALVRYGADAAGRVLIDAPAPGTRWFVGAPGFAVRAFGPDAGRVELARLERVRLAGRDLMGRPLAAGLSVRLPLAHERPRGFSWEASGGWRSLEDSEAFVPPGDGPLELRYADGCEGRAFCWRPEADVDDVPEEQWFGVAWELQQPFTGTGYVRRRGVEGPDELTVFVEPHGAHVTRGVRIAEASGAPLSGVDVSLRGGEQRLDRGRTDDAGLVRYDVTRLAPAHRDGSKAWPAHVTLELERDGAALGSVDVELAALLETDPYELVLTPLTIALEGGDPAAFGFQTSTVHRGALDSSPRGAADHLAEALTKASAAVRAFGADGKAAVLVPKGAERLCAWVVHRASGVAGGLRVVQGADLGAGPLALTAPALGRLELAGPLAARSDFALLLMPAIEPGVAPLGTRPMTPLPGPLSALELPAGRYAVGLLFNKVVVNGYEVEIVAGETARLELLAYDQRAARVVRGEVGHGRELFLASGRVHVGVGPMSPVSLPLDPDGTFEVLMVGTPEELRVSLDGGPKPTALAELTWLDSDHVRADLVLGELEVSWPASAALGTGLELAVLSDLGAEVARLAAPANGAPTTRPLPAGSYTARLDGSGVEWETDFEVVARELARVAVELPAAGAIDVVVVGPFGADCSLEFDPDDELARAGAWQPAEWNGPLDPARAFHRVASPGAYEVEVEVEWEPAEDVRLRARAKADAVVQPGARTKVRLDLTDPLREEARRWLADDPFALAWVLRVLG